MRPDVDDEDGGVVEPDGVEVGGGEGGEGGGRGGHGRGEGSGDGGQRYESGDAGVDCVRKRG